MAKPTALSATTTALKQAEQSLRAGIKQGRPEPIALAVANGRVVVAWELEDLLNWALNEFQGWRIVQPTGAEIGESSQVMIEARTGRLEWLLQTPTADLPAAQLPLTATQPLAIEASPTTRP